MIARAYDVGELDGTSTTCDGALYLLRSLSSDSYDLYMSNGRLSHYLLSIFVIRHGCQLLTY